MAIQNLWNIEILTPDKGIVRSLPEAASASFKRMEFVTLSSGKVAALSGTDPAAATILGVVLHDAAVITDNPTLVFVPDPECQFIGNIYHATPSSAVTAVTDVGTNYGLVEVSDKVHVDKADTTNTKVKITDLDTRDAVGDRYGRVIFRIDAAVLQTPGAVS